MDHTYKGIIKRPMTINIVVAYTLVSLYVYLGVYLLFRDYEVFIFIIFNYFLLLAISHC